MPANDQADKALDLTVREFLERSARAIVKGSNYGPDFDKRVDLYYELTFTDPKLGRKHPILVRLKITAQSMIFDRRRRRSDNQSP